MQLTASRFCIGTQPNLTYMDTHRFKAVAMKTTCATPHWSALDMQMLLEAVF